MMGEKTGTVSTLTRADLKHLVRSVDGDVALPGDEAYDHLRRVFNGSVDHHPSLILQCTGPGDVMEGVAFARMHKLPLSVKGGGSSVSGASVLDDAMVLDLSQIKDIVIDESADTVRAGPGLTWGELNKRISDKELATTCSMVSSVGISGLTLDGGVGWLMGSFGLTCDNLVSADVVTAEGDLLTASKEERQDLFWALCGGGGNFGVVTSFEYRLHDVVEVYGGIVAWPMNKAIEVLRGARRLMKTIPDKLDIIFALMDAPIIGPAVSGMVCYRGDQKHGEKALDPLIRVGRPDVNDLELRPFYGISKMADPFARPGLMNHWNSGFMTGLSDDAIKALVAMGRSLPSTDSAIHIWCHHGAVCKIASDAAAFPHREKQFNVHLISMWDDPRDNSSNLVWADRGWGELEQHLTGAAYSGFTPQKAGSPQRVFKSNYRRLRELKERYDPENMFRPEHNVIPSAW